MLVSLDLKLTVFPILTVFSHCLMFPILSGSERIDGRPDLIDQVDLDQIIKSMTLQFHFNVFLTSQGKNPPKEWLLCLAALFKWNKSDALERKRNKVR